MSSQPHSAATPSTSPSRSRRSSSAVITGGSTRRRGPSTRGCRLTRRSSISMVASSRLTVRPHAVKLCPVYHVTKKVQSSETAGSEELDYMQTRDHLRYLLHVRHMVSVPQAPLARSSSNHTPSLVDLLTVSHPAHPDPDHLPVNIAFSTAPVPTLSLGFSLARGGRIIRLEVQVGPNAHYC